MQICVGYFQKQEVISIRRVIQAMFCHEKRNKTIETEVNRFPVSLDTAVDYGISPFEHVLKKVCTSKQAVADQKGVAD